MRKERTGQLWGHIFVSAHGDEMNELSYKSLQDNKTLGNASARHSYHPSVSELFYNDCTTLHLYKMVEMTLVHVPSYSFHNMAIIMLGCRAHTYILLSPYFTQR